MSRESYERMVERMRVVAPGVEPLPFEESGFVVECSAKEDRARGEFLKETDALYQLRMFGAGRPFESGFVDANLDLLRAHELVQDAASAWSRLPSHVREKYRDWGELETAAASGELQAYLKARAAASSAGSSGDGAGAPPSESAAGG